MLFFFLSALESEADKQLFMALYEQYHEQMESIAIHILKEQKDAEDAMQNAFLQVIKHFEKIHKIPRKERLYWIISIVKNESFMILRKRKQIVTLDEWEGYVGKEEQATSYREIVELFRRLPVTYRSVLEMKILIGYTDEEISRHLGISKAAVSTRVNRGRGLLREIAGKEGLWP